MAGTEHRFLRHPPANLRARIKGQVYSCSCGAVRLGGSLVDAILWHAEHVRTLPEERAQRLAEIQRELDDVQAQLAALTDA